MTPVHSTLVDARALIERRKHWGKGVMARNARGERVEFDDPAACRFCLVGAVLAASSRHEASWLQTALQLLYEAAGVDCMIALMTANDAQTHGGALRLLDRAIAADEQVPA